MRNKRITIILLIFMLFSLPVFTKNPIYAQRSVYHNLGKFFVNMTYNHDWDDQNHTDAIIYPNGFYKRSVIQYWRMAMVAKNWKAPGGVPEDETPVTGGYYGISMTEYRKNAPPTIKVGGIDITEAWKGTVDNSIPSDVYVDWKFKTLEEIGIEVNHKTYSFVNQNHDDYVIFDITCKFTGDIDQTMGQDVDNQTIDFAWACFFDFEPTEIANEKLYGKGLWRPGNWSWATWGYYTEYTGKPLSVTGKPRDDLMISYTYSGDDTRAKEPVGHTESGTPPYYNNQGVPDPLTGQFLAMQSCGLTTFYADKSASDESDDYENKPANVAWMYHTDMTGLMWPHGFWGFLTDTDPDFNRKEHFIEYNHPDNDWNSVRGNFFLKHGYGPYELSIGDDVRSVFAIGAGMIDENLCVSEGAKWYNWYWDKPGSKLDDAGKEALVWQGVDRLFTHMDNAYLAYNNGYNVPDPPPAPDIEVEGQAGRIEIKWSYPDENMYNDPDTGVDDFLEWRVYRKLGAFLIDHEDDAGNYYPYELIGTFGKNVTSYNDLNVTMGNKYHYCVTAVDDGSQNTEHSGQELESSYYANRTSQPTSSTKLGLSTTEDVLIVPNPYSISTGVSNEMNWPGYPDEIRFVNLPVYCTLKIYTATGELIKTIEHTDRTIDEAWEGLRTDSNQYPSSGVYILVVENAKDDDKNPLPKKFYKFVIVR